MGSLLTYIACHHMHCHLQHMADLHDRFRRRLVYSCGTWKAEVLHDFDVRTLMREVTLDGPDAQQAYHDYMGRVSIACLWVCWTYVCCVLHA